MTVPLIGPKASPPLFDLSGADETPFSGLVGTVNSFRKVSNNLAASTAAGSARAYKPQTMYQPPDEVWGTLTAKGADTSFWDLILGWRDIALSTESFYELEFDPVVGTDTVQLFAKQSGAGGLLTTFVTQEIGATDSWALHRDVAGQQASLTAYRWDNVSNANDPAGWVQQGSTFTHTPTDLDLLLPGVFGLEATGNSAWRMSAFGGGTTLVSPMITIAAPMTVVH